MAASLLPLAFLSLLCGCLASQATLVPADEVALLQGKLSQSDERSSLAPTPTSEERLKQAMDLASGRQGDKVNDVPADFTQPMVNFGDAQYVSYLKMGKQMIAGIIDTGSFELVVFGADCFACSVAAHYNHRLSETYEQGTVSTVHNYGSGGVLCNEAMEKVSMGPFPTAKQMFWEVIDAQMPVLQNAAFEAIVGVGPTENALLGVYAEVDRRIKNLTYYYDQSMMAPADMVLDAQAMVEIALKLSNELPMLHTWSVQQFSICMGAGKGSDGIMVWSDSRPKRQPELFKTVPVNGASKTWSAEMSSPTLLGGQGKTGGVELPGCEQGCQALLDSGTSLLAAPTAAVNGIIEAMNALNPDCSNLDVLPTLTFKLGPNGQQSAFSLPPSAYIGQLTGPVSDYVKDRLPSRAKTNQTANQTVRACELLMMDTGGFGEGALWILGVPFFRKYYTNFDLGAHLEERAFHIAPHSPTECVPMSERELGMAVERQPEKLRQVEAGRLHLPHPRRTVRKWTPRRL